jgi:trk system potassium uptake protein
MKQFAVIGVGNFGYYLATHLYAKGHEVLAIDSDGGRIQEIKDKVSQAVLADATDRKALETLGLDRMDAVAVSVGDVLSNSILVCLNLIDLDVQRLVAKAISEPHGRVLQKIGVHEVVYPERDLAITLAERLHSPNILEYLPFIDDYSIVEIAPPAHFVGKRLSELDLINHYGIQVIAIKELVPDRMNMIPTGSYLMKDSDILIILGPQEGIDKLRRDTL